MHVYIYICHTVEYSKDRYTQTLLLTFSNTFTTVSMINDQILFLLPISLVRLQG